MVSEGQTVRVKVLAVDDRGKVKLSMRVVNQETGEDLGDMPREGGGGGGRPPRERRPRSEEANDG